MATLAQWIEGARPRTLPAAAAPVMAGTATALVAQQRLDSTDLLLVVLAAVIALALQVGVNYANDYSDGIRGTDADRVGPLRLVGSGVARPRRVKDAAFACFGVAALAGLAAVVVTHLWWLLAVGALSIVAAWFYTGGKRPYGYLGLGEVFVFVFFGLVAVMGTHLLLTGRLAWSSLVAAVAVGVLACAILVTNNLRDIAGDQRSGKRTLATRLGDHGTRMLYVVLTSVSLLAVVALAAATTGWLLLAVVAAVPLLAARRSVSSGAVGHGLVRVLALTGLAELLLGAGLLLGAILSVL